jgi:hypothetical protein
VASALKGRLVEARVGIEPTYKGFADPLVSSPSPFDSSPPYQKSKFRPLFVPFPPSSLGQIRGQNREDRNVREEFPNDRSGSGEDISG